MFTEIDPDTYYEALSPALNVLGKPQTRARHRHEGKGCPYIKLDHRIIYHGKVVLEHLAENTVVPKAA